MKSQDRAVFKLETFVLIEYIKSAIEIVLEIKFDEIEKRIKV